MQSVWIGITNTKSENDLINEIGITIKKSIHNSELCSIIQKIWQILPNLCDGCQV